LLLDDSGVSDVAALPHALGEFGNGRKPLIDRAAGNLEAAGQIIVGGAQHAELAGELARRKLNEGKVVGRELVVPVATRRHCLILLKNRSTRFQAR
jgi:hypothetical protein